MRAKSRESRRRATPAAAPAARTPGPAKWPYAVAAAAVLVVFWAYGPVLHGAFLFDDYVFPFALPHFSAPLRAWIGHVRPVLYFSYWINAQLSKDDPFSYHVVNVAIHCISGGLIFFIVRRLLEWARADRLRRDLLAGFAAALFLLHPVQTEAVAYLAGRSEGLSAMFLFAAFATFLYRQNPAVSWRAAGAVLLLFGLAMLSKETAFALPALLLLTDYWWNPGFSLRGMRANWRLYVPTALGALGGVAFFWRIITSSESAGFGLKDFTWYQYFFTQCRALFVYMREFVLPVNLTADWDFPVSKTILDRGAIIGLIVLVALAVIAWRYRRRFPLAAFGLFAFLVLMAPTSSVLPIRDTIAERRLYLAMPGLLLIVVDFLGRLKVDRKALAVACLVVVVMEAAAARARAAVWNDPLSLWQDTARKSPGKARVRFQLGFSYYDHGLPDLAIKEFEKTAQLDPPAWMKFNLLADWGLAYDAADQPEQALARFRQAAAMEPTAHIYSQMAVVYAKRARWDEALAELATAEKLDPNFAPTYLYRGNVFVKQNRPAEAIPQYQRALALDATLDEARQNLRIAIEEQQALQRGGR